MPSSELPVDLRTTTASSEEDAPSVLAVDGFTAPGFAPVLDAFLADVTAFRRAGAAVCVYHRGVPVVHLAAGTARPGTATPYRRSTLQPILSVSKGLVALCANMLADHGDLDLDAPVAHYWPRFGEHGKADIPVRWLLTHQAGLAALDKPISYQDLLTWNPVIRRLEDQTPNWPPGTAHGYHTLTFGFLVGEIIRRISGLTVGQYVARHVTGPLQVPCYIGLPDDKRSDVHIAPVLPINPLPEPTPESASPQPDSLARRTLITFVDPPLSLAAVNDPDLQRAQVPAVNGVGSAFALATIFAALINPVGRLRLLSPEAMNHARAEHVRGPDLTALAMRETALGLGFLLPTEECPLAGPGSFGTAGLGGPLAWASPEHDLALAYPTTHLTTTKPDPRSNRLTQAALTCTLRLRSL